MGKAQGEKTEIEKSDKAEVETAGKTGREGAQRLDFANIHLAFLAITRYPWVRIAPARSRTGITGFKARCAKPLHHGSTSMARGRFELPTFGLAIRGSIH